MIIPFHIIQMLKQQSGNELRQPSDCQFLSLDIEGKTGIRIGTTTLKRLLGFAKDERDPHMSTLDAIAHYLGYAHWDELQQIEYKGNSDFEAIEGEIRAEGLPADALVEVTYLPDRYLVFRHLEGQQFIVVNSRNSKLKEGDHVTILNFVPHHPLFVQDVVRDQRTLGSFTAGRISGLSSIKVL